MKRIITLLIICFGIVAGQTLNTPLLVSGNINNANGAIISGQDLRLKVYLEDHPQDFLTQNSSSCGYLPPVWFAELGNLTFPWEFGDVLIIIIEDIYKVEKIRYSWQIDETAEVPDLLTQKISSTEQITKFSLSDRGVVNNIPLNFFVEIDFGLVTDLEIRIMSQMGNEVFKSVNPVEISPNIYSFTWHGRSAHGRQLRSGIYYYYLINKNNVVHSGMVTLKNE
jgi:hypothetical protein